MTTSLIKADDFTIWAEGVEIVKSKSDGERRIGGYCSTEHLDRQSEVVMQKGLDFNEFVNHGYFNDNHSQATSAVVGVPDSAEYHKGKGWYTEGTLLKGFPRADEIWGLAKSLVGTKRKLGFSIEGKVLERRDNYIVKAKIRNVAITNCPVNTACTWDVLSKSFHPEMSEFGFQAADFERALVAGQAKGEGGLAVVPEDLEHDEVKQLWTCPDCNKAFATARGLERHVGGHGKKSMAVEAVRYVRRSQALSADDAIRLLKSLRPQYSDVTCRRIVSYACKE